MAPLPGGGLLQYVHLGVQDIHLTNCKSSKIVCFKCFKIMKQDNCKFCNKVSEYYNECSCSGLTSFNRDKDKYKKLGMNIKFARYLLMVGICLNVCAGCNPEILCCWRCENKIYRIQRSLKKLIFNKKLQYKKDLWFRTLYQIKGYPQFEIIQGSTIIGRDARKDLSDTFNLNIIIGSETGINFYGVTPDTPSDVFNQPYIKKAAKDMISKNLEIYIHNRRLKKVQGFVNKCLSTIKNYPQLDYTPFHSIIGKEYRKKYENSGKLIQNWVDQFDFS